MLSSLSTLTDSPTPWLWLLVLSFGNRLVEPLFTWISTVFFYLVRRCIVRVEIPKRNSKYDDLHMWLQSNWNRVLYCDLVIAKNENNENLLKYSNGVGWIVFYNNYRVYWIYKELYQPTSSYYNEEHAIVYTWGWSPRIVFRFLHTINKLSKQRSHDYKPKIYHFDRNYWAPMNNTCVDRSAQTLFLNRNQLNDIVQDVKQFCKDEPFYQKSGIPYRRVILFHGKPGSGKTSIVAILAKLFKRDIYVLSLTGMSDESLAKAMNSFRSKRAIVLVEDVDTMLPTRKTSLQTKRVSDKDDSAKTEKTSLSLSAILNCLDGITMTPGRIIIMTTNNISALQEEAITRRIDRAFYFDYASHKQIQKLFAVFFPQASTTVVHKFLQCIPPRSQSMASIQQHLLQYRSDVQLCLKHATAL